MLHIEKWQGLGNDFIVVDEAVEPERAAKICDRRFGVGGDGVLVVSEVSGAPRMVVLNADGSRPEMCGNGLRCVVGHLAQKRGLEQGELVVATDAGDKTCRFRRRDEGLYEVSVAMGAARIDEDFTFDHGGKAWRFTPVDMGNPHAVSFDDHVDEDLDGVGPALERQRPGGVNVELCRLAGRRIDVIVHERGVGRTLACGTGACAVAAAAWSRGHLELGEPVEVRLPGGALTIRVAPESHEVTMVGPAIWVFAGESAL